MDSMRRVASVLVALTLLAGCGGDAAQDNADAESADETTATGEAVATTYAPELNVDLSAMTRHPSGLHTMDLEEGEGEPVAAGQTVRMRYTGWLPDGTQFDSNVGGNLLTVTIGAGGVIRGWDEGLPGMRLGGKRRLVIPPSMGYGADGYPGAIPPNSTLVFDVELVEIAG